MSLKDYKLQKIERCDFDDCFPHTAIFVYNEDTWTLPIAEKEAEQLEIGDSVNDLLLVATDLNFTANLKDICNNKECDTCLVRFICYTERE